MPEARLQRTREAYRDGPREGEQWWRPGDTVMGQEVWSLTHPDFKPTSSRLDVLIAWLKRQCGRY